MRMALRGIDFNHATTFWVTLLRLLTQRHVVREQLDVKMDQAIPRAWWITVWTVLTLGGSLLILYAGEIGPLLSGLPGAEWVLPLYWVMSVVFALVVGIPVTYGFLRLYTLVSHVLILNVFKTRGQRLRLLNCTCTFMTLSAPLSAGLLAYAVRPWLGASIIAATLVYALVLLSRAFNTIFHKTYLGGLGLLVGGTLVTWFVLAICALGIAVTLSVLSFFVLAILRIFKHG